MKILTANQKAVLAVLRNSSMPLTVREIADSRAMSDSSVRSALTALDRAGAVGRCGVSMQGGATWFVLGRTWTACAPDRLAGESA